MFLYRTTVEILICKLPTSIMDEREQGFQCTVLIQFVPGTGGLVDYTLPYLECPGLESRSRDWLFCFFAGFPIPRMQIVVGEKNSVTGTNLMTAPPTERYYVSE